MLEIESWLKELGFSFGALINDGQIHRCDRGKNNNGWYVIFTAPFKICVAGDWSTQEKFTYKGEQKYTREQNAEIKKIIAEKVKIAEEKRSKDANTIAKETLAEFSGLPQASIDHPYLAKKGIGTYGTVKERNGCLIIPTFDFDNMWGWQVIDREGNKKFRKGQKFKGTYFPFWNELSKIYICEGFATGATIFETTRHSTICAFSVSNLLDVASIMRNQYPGSEIIIAADNDQFTDKNPGLTTAQHVSKKLGVSYVYPTFKNVTSKPTDFNDLLLLQGVDEVRKQLDTYSPPTPEEEAPVKKKRTSVVELQSNIIGLLNKNPSSPLTTKFNFNAKFHMVYPSQGDFILLREAEGGIVSVTKIFDIEQELAKFLRLHKAVLPEYQWSQKQIKAVIALWLLQTTAIPMPKTWAWKDDESLTFHRLPWEKGVTGDFSTWREILTRMSNAEAFMVWVGSLFFEQSDRQSYVWLHGEGSNSKGSILRFFHNVFGNAFSSETPPTNNFWSAGLLGKRVVAFFDTNDVDWPTSGFFKSLSGNDPIRMEIKGGATFTSRIVAKFIFASNSRPSLSSEVADLRRAIFCELGSMLGEADPTYEDKLWSEGGAFITACMATYEKACPNHEAIKSDASVLLDWIGALEDRFECAVNQYLSLFVDEPAIPQKDKPFTRATDFTRFIEYCFRDKNDQQKFRKFLERKYNLKRITVKISENTYDARFLNVGLRINEIPWNPNRNR